MPSKVVELGPQEHLIYTALKSRKSVHIMDLLSLARPDLFGERGTCLVSGRSAQQLVGAVVARINRWFKLNEATLHISPGIQRRTYKLKTLGR